MGMEEESLSEEKEGREEIEVKKVKSFVQEKENILYILSTAKKAIKKKNITLLKELSDHTVHSASIYQDVDSITVAVLIYALSDIFERGKYTTYVDWSLFSKACIESLAKAEDDLKKDRIEEFRKDLLSIRQAVNKLSGHLRTYIEDVFRRAMIKKASRVYEHGISLKQTADLLGISAWELAEYAGKTGISDVDLSITTNIKTRIKKAIDIFG